MSGRNNVVCRFDTRIITQSLIRPSNTTQYAAGEVISEVTTNNHFTFADLANPGQLSGQIDRAIITSSADGSGVLLPDLELWLFDTDIAEVADNAAFAPTDAEMLTLVGVIDFPVANWKVGLSGGNSCCEGDRAGGNPLPMLYKCKTVASFSLYGQLVTRNAYTPVSAEVFSVRLIVTRD